MSSTDILVDIDKSLARSIGKSSKMLGYHLDEAFHAEGLDLSKEQMLVLKKLHEKDGLIQNELAALTFRDKSSLARLLIKMERKNYIFRKQDDFDRRLNRVFLTEEGKTIFLKTRPIMIRLNNIIERNISERDIIQLRKTLDRIQQNLIAANSSN